MEGLELGCVGAPGVNSISKVYNSYLTYSVLLSESTWVSGKAQPGWLVEIIDSFHIGASLMGFSNPWILSIFLEQRMIFHNQDISSRLSGPDVKTNNPAI